MLEIRLTRHSLKVRKSIAIILILLASVVSVVGIWSWIIGMNPPLGFITILLGLLLLVVGILIFITEMFESWLSQGQAALVDGLQAG